MSAELLALAARAADGYVKVRGPWCPPNRAIEIEPDPLSSWCTIRESHPAKHGDVLLFNPLSRKEKPVPDSPVAQRSLDRIFMGVVTFFVGAGPITVHRNEPLGLIPRTVHVVFGDNQVDMVLQDLKAVTRLRELLDEAAGFLGGQP